MHSAVQEYTLLFTKGYGDVFSSSLDSGPEEPPGASENFRVWCRVVLADILSALALCQALYLALY